MKRREVFGKGIKALLLCLCISCTVSVVSAQAGMPDFSFGNVKAEDFSPAAYSVDSSAEAVYLFDVGSVYFHEPDYRHYEIVSLRHVRIRILNKNAFNLATLVLSLDKGDYEETLDKLDAAVYNLKDGKVVSQQIDKASVFTLKSKDEKKIKLTLPNVTVGSIIEFAYTVITPGIDLPGWYFQTSYPVLWSRFEVVIPYFFNYAVLKQGDLKFVTDSTSSFHTDYLTNYYSPGEENTLQHTWLMKNVPGMVKEPFVSTLDNYLDKIEFQLSAYRNSSGNNIAVSRDWLNVCIDLAKNPVYLMVQDTDEKSLNQTIKKVCGDDTAALQKAKDLYAYVRDNFTCMYPYGKGRTREIRETIQTKKETAGDLNLLLYNLLSKAGLTVQPVLLSTVGHGKIRYEYPVLSDYNYVICRLIADKKLYLLDASSKYLPFGVLPDDCYNGYGRALMPPLSEGFVLSPNAITDSIVTEINFQGESNNTSISTTLGKQSSATVKALLKNEDEKENARQLKNILFADAPLTDAKLKGSSADSSLTFTYRIPVEPFEENTVYVSPLVSLQMKSNPFPAGQRIHDIELPHCREDIFHVVMNIPEGYEVNEMPKPLTIDADDIRCHFTYSVKQTDSNRLEADIKINIGKAIFEPGEYDSLRKFYSDVLIKEAEQIVFKKK